MKYTTILFDLDGTLLNTLVDLRNSVNYALEQFGYPVQSLENIRNYVGNGVAMLVHRSVPNGTSTEDEVRCLAIFKEHYMVHMNDNTCPYDGLLPVMHELKTRGCLIGIVSNKIEPAVKELADKFFPELIDVAVGDLPERNKKPAPDSTLAAMKQLSVSSDTCLYIGDTDIDVLTAHNAGIPCVGVTWGFRDRDVLEGAEFIIDTPEELLKLL